MMSEEREIAKTRYFRDGERFGDYEIVALRPPRRAVLERRRNKWVAPEGKEKEQTDEHCIAEWLFVLSRTAEELAGMVLMPDVEWDGEVEKFLLGLEDDVFEAFAMRLFDEFGALRAVSVQPADDDEPGKASGEETAAPSPVGSQISAPPEWSVD